MPPIYDYDCEDGHHFTRFLKLADYKEPQTCDCGKPSKRKIMPTMINCDMQNWDRYESPVSGRLITSYKERRADMAEHGCTDYDPGMVNSTTSHMEAEDRKVEKRMDETVEKTICEMPVRKREALDRELSSGADIAYERK